MNRVLIIAGAALWLIAPWFFTLNPAEPRLFQWGLCLSHEGADCLRSIYWLDFLLIGGGLIGLGWWLGRRKALAQS